MRQVNPLNRTFSIARETQKRTLESEQERLQRTPPKHPPSRENPSRGDAGLPTVYPGSKKVSEVSVLLPEQPQPRHPLEFATVAGGQNRVVPHALRGDEDVIRTDGCA